MGGDIRKKILQELLEHMEYYNLMAPFPVFDTYYIELLKHKIKMEHISYDDEPVVACSHCKSLFIITDEDDNDHCVKCRNSVNDVEVFLNIGKYLAKYGDLWNIDEQKDEKPETS